MARSGHSLACVIRLQEVHVISVVGHATLLRWFCAQMSPKLSPSSPRIRLFYVAIGRRVKTAHEVIGQLSWWTLWSSSRTAEQRVAARYRIRLTLPLWWLYMLPTEARSKATIQTRPIDGGSRSGRRLRPTRGRAHRGAGSWAATAVEVTRVIKLQSHTYGCVRFYVSVRLRVRVWRNKVRGEQGWTASGRQ